MPDLLDGYTASHTMRKVIAAEDYNRIRLALRRLGNPIRLELTAMKCLDMILTDRYWVCVDTCMGDRPILAWTDFELADRCAIHAPVGCALRMYHVHAGLVMGEVLDALGAELRRELDALGR